MAETYSLKKSPRTTFNWDEVRKKYGNALDLHTENL